MNSLRSIRVKSRATATRQPPLRGGYALLELIISAAAASVLMVGLASTLLISGHAFDGVGQTSDRLRAIAAQADLASDLSEATSIRARSAAAITFTVPDRDGDGLEEILSYSWDGVPGGEMLRSRNTDPPLSILSGVNDFQLTYLDRTLTAPPYTPPPLNPDQWGERWRTGPFKFGYDVQFANNAASTSTQIATKVTLPYSGTLTSLAAYIHAGNNQRFRLAIYSNTPAGEPGTLLVQTATGRASNPAWHTLPVTPTALSAGTYWLALSLNHPSQRIYYELGGDLRLVNHDAVGNGFLPNWPGISQAYNAKLSIYGVAQ